MFGSGGAGIWGGLAPPSDDLLDKPRAPPPRPLPLDFPNHAPKCQPRPLGRRRSSALRNSIISLRRPTDNNEAVITLLNLHLSSEVRLQDFVPADFLPQRPYLYEADLEAMLAELKVENEDAFREVLRQKPKEGRTKPRIAYSRNFYGNLEDMSRYVDCSKDKYFDATEDETDPDGDSEMSDSGSTSPKKTKPMYQGHRLGNAAQLPPATRIGAARNLLKMVVHKFHCRDYDISPKERLRIRDISLPPGLVMYNFMVGKTPLDRTLARARNVEGPVLGVSVRHECIFDDELFKDLTVTRERSEIGDYLGPQVDLLRETGSALAIALQRNRQGKTKQSEHERITNQWWWAQKPRWGGGETRWGMLASEVFEDEDPSWSPEERKLQLEKREKTQADMKRIDEATRGAGSSNPADGLSVTDLIAKSEESASLKGPGGISPTAGLLAEKNSMRIPRLTPTDNAAGGSGEMGSDEKPPKKKNRLTVPVAGSSSPQSSSKSPDSSPSSPASTLQSATSAATKKLHLTTDTATDTASSSTASLKNPALNSSSKPSAATPLEAHTAAKSFGQHKHTASGNCGRREEKEKAPEFKDGRRLMYTAPMRRKWFKEWGNVKPNASTWDEKVIWKRTGAPVSTPIPASGGDGGSAVSGDAEQQQQPQAGQGGSNKAGSEGVDVDMANNGVGHTSDAQSDTAKAETPKQAHQERQSDEEFDEIYQVSCVNHHVALLKMRVSRRYLRWLESGDPEAEAASASTKFPNGGTDDLASGAAEGTSMPGTGPNSDRPSTHPPPTNTHRHRKAKEVSESDILQLKRSRYYDLFSIPERTEFFEALWRVMCWLLRDEAPVKAELERVMGSLAT